MTKNDDDNKDMGLAFTERERERERERGMNIYTQNGRSELTLMEEVKTNDNVSCRGQMVD